MIDSHRTLSDPQHRPVRVSSLSSPFHTIDLVKRRLFRKTSNFFSLLFFQIFL